MKHCLPPIPASLLARQTPEVRAMLAKARRASPKQAAPVTATVTREGDVVTVVLSGLEMPNFSNLRPRVVIAAKCRQRDALRPVLARITPPPLPWDVTITRIAPRALDVGDNEACSGKKLRDLIAEWIGVNDRTSERVRYTVAQETGATACRITIRPMNTASLPDVSR